MKPVAVVTGAAQGIGEAIARRLATDSFVIAIDRQDCSALAADIEGKALSADLADFHLLEPLVERISNEFGAPVRLVNCAGVCTTQPIDAITPEGWANTFAVNVHGAFFLARACAERMKASGSGAIVNIASVSGFLPKLEQIDYGASKAALVSLTRSLALIYGPQNVRVNAVAPGVIDTPLTLAIAEQRGKIRGVPPEETLIPTLQATPLRRTGTPKEVADAVAFLLSDDAAYITGQTLDVCGGFLMR